MCLEPQYAISQLYTAGITTAWQQAVMAANTTESTKSYPRQTEGSHTYLLYCILGVNLSSHLKIYQRHKEQNTA